MEQPKYELLEANRYRAPDGTLWHARADAPFINGRVYRIFYKREARGLAVYLQIIKVPDATAET